MKIILLATACSLDMLNVSQHEEHTKVNNMCSGCRNIKAHANTHIPIFKKFLVPTRAKWASIPERGLYT